jgi:carbon storage regulator
MLVLTRRKGDTVKIGDDIEVTVVDVEDGSVRLGIKAPKTTVILRGELYSAVETENRRAD